MKVRLSFVSGGALKDRLAEEHVPLRASKERLWVAADAAEATSYLHAYNVIHCDIQLTRFMLLDDSRSCVIDFAGSRMQDQEGTAMESTRHLLPRPDDEPSSVRTDLFALVPFSSPFPLVRLPSKTRVRKKGRSFIHRSISEHSTYDLWCRRSTLLDSQA